jgi:hypothetical protein
MPGKTGTALAAIVCLAALIVGVWIAGGKAGNHPARLTVESPEIVALPDGASETQGPLYRVHVLWEDDRQPAVGTSVTLVYEPSKKGNENATSAPSRGEAPVPPQTLKTDASGVAAFPLPQGGTQLRIEAARAYAFSQSTTVTVTATQEATLLLKKAYECFGTVYAVNDAGTTVPLQGARVSVRNSKDFPTRSNPKGAGEAGNGVLSDDRGRFHLVSPTPQVVLQASKGPLVAPLLEKDRHLRTLRHEVENGPYDLVLEKGCSLLVSVLRKDTMEGIEGARVEVEGTCPEKPLATNKTGECEIQGLPQGMQKVAVWADGYTRESALVALSPKEGNLAVFTLVPAGQIRVFTVDDKDQPLGGVGVSLQIKKTSAIVEEIFTDETGHGELNHAPLDQPLLLNSVKGCLYWVNPQGVLFTKESEPQEVKLVCGSSQPSQPGMEGPYWLKGRVVEETSRQPVPGLMVESRSGKRDNTDEKGEFHIRGIVVPEGENSTTDFMVGGKGYKAVIQTKVPLNTFVEVEISPSRVLHGKVVDSKTNEPVQSFSVKTNWTVGEQESSWLRIFSLDGTFEFEDILPDNIDSIKSENSHVHIPVTIEADRYETMTRDFNFDEFKKSPEILFVLNPANKASGKVVDAKTHEPVPGALVGYNEGVSTRSSFSKNDLKPDSYSNSFKVYGKTDEKGEFALDVSCNSGTFKVFAEGYAPKAWPVTSDKSFPLDIPLEKAGSLKVRFRQADTAPMFVGVARVDVRSQDAGQELICRYHEYEKVEPNALVWRSLPDGKGRVKVLISSSERVADNSAGPDDEMQLELVSDRLTKGGLGYNPVTINFWRDKNPYVWTEIARPVEISGGKETEVEVPADGALSGRLTLKGTPVQGVVFLESRQADATYRYMVSTNEEGFYQIPALAAGSYTVFVSVIEKQDEGMTAHYSAPYRDSLDIAGSVQKNFELDGVLGHKMMGTFRQDTMAARVYAPGGKGNFYELRLERIPDPSESSVSVDKIGTAYIFHKSSEKEDAVLSFSTKGRFFGKYKLILEGQQINPQEKTFFEFPEPLTLDNRAGDQDLGELDCRAVGPLSLTVTILNPEYLDASGRYVELVLEKMSPPPLCRSVVAFCTPGTEGFQGTVTAQGLLPGEYRVRLIGGGGGIYNGTDFDVKTLTLQDNVTLQYDARELGKKPGGNQ